MKPAPLYFVWTDAGVMLPVSARAAERQFTAGEKYRLAVEEERSASSHNHQFAEIENAWENLPRGLAEQFPTPEHLRKRALIEAGFYNQEIIDCGSVEVAGRVAAFVGKHDAYAVVAISPEGFVVIRRAKSQSIRAMKKEEFQKSKTAVLEIIAAMVGVSAPELTANAGVSA
jgi:hypothetical protein